MGKSFHPRRFHMHFAADGAHINVWEMQCLLACATRLASENKALCNCDRFRSPPRDKSVLIATGGAARARMLHL